MAVITIYKCDKCGAEQSTSEQFWYLAVVYKSLHLNYGESKTKGINVCRKCLEHLGINATPQTKESSEYSPPTIEELIVEIVQREFDAR